MYRGRVCCQFEEVFVMRPGLSGLHLVVCAAMLAGPTGCGLEQDGLKGKIVGLRGIGG